MNKPHENIARVTDSNLVEMVNRPNKPAGKKFHFHNQNALRCPHCGHTGRIDVEAAVWVRLQLNGSNANVSHDGTHQWDVHSAAYCGNCEFHGIIQDFQTYQCQKCRQIHNEMLVRSKRHPVCPTCGGACRYLASSGEVKSGK